METWNFGRDLCGYHSIPTNARAAVLVLHGYAEHFGRYDSVVSAMHNAGFAVYGYDQRGHGRSFGTRALIRISELVEDHLAAREWLRQHEPLPLFTLSHSMGGLVSVTSTLRDPRGLTGVILSAPSLIVGHDQPPFLRKLAPLLGTLAPHMSVDSIRKGILSRREAAQTLFDHDPLCYTGKVKARTAAELIQGGDAVWKNLHKWTLPTLMIHGDADQLITIEGSRRFIRNISSSDKELWEVAGGFHELLNDLESEQATQKILEWLEAHV